MSFAPLVTETKTATSTSQSQSVATRGRPQFREHESCQGPASHSRTGRDRGPPLEDLETGPPPEDLKSCKEGLPVKTQWMTSWNSRPQVGEGT